MAKAIQNLDRERYSLEKQEPKLLLKMKQMVKKNEPEAVRSMVNDLVVVRSQIKKLAQMKQQLEAVATQFKGSESETQEGLNQAVYQATQAMRDANAKFNLSRLKQILKEFEKQSKGLEQIKDGEAGTIGESLAQVQGQVDSDDGDDR